MSQYWPSKPLATARVTTGEELSGLSILGDGRPQGSPLRGCGCGQGFRGSGRHGARTPEADVARHPVGGGLEADCQPDVARVADIPTAARHAEDALLRAGGVRIESVRRGGLIEIFGVVISRPLPRVAG